MAEATQNVPSYISKMSFEPHCNLQWKESPAAHGTFPSRRAAVSESSWKRSATLRVPASTTSLRPVRNASAKIRVISWIVQQCARCMTGLISTPCNRGFTRHWPGWMPIWPPSTPCPGATSTRHEPARYWWLRIQGHGADPLVAC